MRIPIDISITETDLIIELSKKYNVAVCFNWNGIERKPIIIKEFV